MIESRSLFGILRQSADADCVTAIERLVADASDHQLSRINVLAFARRHGLDEEKAIASFLHAARIGLFELSWNVLCPGCGGVLDASATLKSVRAEDYHCALCAAGYAPTLDEMVEVTFTVSPRVRRIAAHDPHTLSNWEYYRQIFWGSGVDLPNADFAKTIENLTLDSVELPPGERAHLSLTLPAEFLIVFEPVIHAAQFIDVKGEPATERQSLTLVYTNLRAPTGTMELRPGPLRLSLENRTDRRILPGIWIANDAMHDFLGKRRPFLTAKRLLSNQTFRDIYRTDTLDVDQRLKITSLTFLFTDLKGSTELYERVGDLAAFDMVREHFRLLHESVAAEGRGQDDRGCRHGNLPDARPWACRGAPHACGHAQPQRGAWTRGPAAKDRHSRRTLPGRESERPTGLFRADRKHRFARPGAGAVAVNPGDGVCDRERATALSSQAFPTLGISRHMGLTKRTQWLTSRNTRASMSGHLRRAAGRFPAHASEGASGSVRRQMPTGRLCVAMALATCVAIGLPSTTQRPSTWQASCNVRAQ
jgi:hypothetical protein